jgi:hypothetical protein
MDRIKIKHADTGAVGCDGQFIVQAWDFEGREYTLLHGDHGIAHFTAFGAIKTLTSVQQRGTIDPALWACRIPYGSAAWLLDGMEERTIEDEKMGLLGGW